MIKKILFIPSILIGLFLIAFSVLRISGVYLTPDSVVELPLSGNASANALSINGNEIVTTGDDSNIIFDIPDAINFKFVEIYLEEASYLNTAADTSVGQIFYAYTDYDFVEVQSVSQKLSVGRNFIEVPDGEYSAVRIDLTNYNGATFDIRAIKLSGELPVRIRHFMAFGFIGALWCVICWMLFFYKISLIFVRMRVFKKYSYLLYNLVKKDFTTKYRRSVLGILWSVLNPLFLAMIISAVFSTIFRVQIENFVVYFLTGSLIFNFISEATSSSLTSVIGAAGLIKKVYIPKYIFPIEKCLFALVNTIFTLAVTFILMPFLGVRLNFSVLLFFIPLAYALVFSIGLGMILSAANIFFRDVQHLYGVWLTAWMYLTPIIYPAELTPDGIKWFSSINPIYYYVGYFRDVMMYNTLPNFQTNVICATFSISALLIGLIIFKLKQDKFILYI